MEFIRRFIQQKISQAAGAEVRFGKVSFSPLSGAVEVHDLCVGNFLTVKRIEAKIAVARALKQEIVVRSLTIEGPTLTIQRDVDGKLNLPPRPQRTGNSQGEKKTWEFEAHKVLLVGGSVSFSDFCGYRISLEKITGSVEMQSVDQAEFVFAADSLGRRDTGFDLGEARMLGKVAGGIDLTLAAGAMLDLNVRGQSLDTGQLDGELNLAMSLATLLALLPSGIRLPITTASGDARLAAKGRFDPSNSAVNLETFELRAGPVTLQ